MGSKVRGAPVLHLLMAYMCLLQCPSGYWRQSWQHAPCMYGVATLRSVMGPSCKPLLLLT